MTGAMTRPPPHMKASSMSSVAASRGNSCHSGRTTCRPIRGEDCGHVTSCRPIPAHRAPGHRVVVEQRVEVGQQPVLGVVLGEMRGLLTRHRQYLATISLHELTAPSTTSLDCEGGAGSSGHAAPSPHSRVLVIGVQHVVVPGEYCTLHYCFDFAPGEGVEGPQLMPAGTQLLCGVANEAADVRPDLVTDI